MLFKFNSFSIVAIPFIANSKKSSNEIPSFVISLILSLSTLRAKALSLYFFFKDLTDKPLISLLGLTNAAAVIKPES